MPTRRTTLRIVIIGLAALAVAMGIGRFAFTPLLPLMRADGLVSVADGGVLASVHFLGYWLGAVFSHKIPFTPRPTLQFSLIAIAVSTLAMGLSDSFILWLVLRWLAGVCSALTLVLVSNYYIKYLADAGAAAKQGWIFSGVGAGIAIAGLGTLILMINQIGSAPGWLLFGLLSLFAAIIIVFKIGPEIPNSRPPMTGRPALRTPLHWGLVIAYGVAGAGYILPATYLPIMAREIVSSPIIFGWSWPVFGLAAFGSTLAAIGLQKIFSNRQVWAASQAVMALGLLVPVLWPHISTIILSGLCVGGTFMIITMVGMREAHRIAPKADVGRHIAIMTAAFASGQMIGPLFGGWLYNLTQSFSAALVLAAVALLITAVTLMLQSSRTPEGG